MQHPRDVQPDSEPVPLQRGRAEWPGERNCRIAAIESALIPGERHVNPATTRTASVATKGMVAGSGNL